eukprot:CAMPEP_0202004470 /NCGR_PEP_ID=MMETSP0905-20130828/9764_1 /ASSEMBLY_ACC=CAM_ASM_000554 /TAXON_ID=420261 /ORGANISM="Thalassiosira antarctica, Strain CCMP982" /LENGTH=450 /DNA_ID=CAMNT_0048561807 /DNA_START=30 /DNA_END=1379 /DNA_ORIENTATION=+
MTAADDDCPTTPSKSLARTSTAKMSSTNGVGAATANSNSNNIGAILSNKIDALPRTFQFLFLVLCVFFFFGIHNVIQESMINTEGFTFGVMLGWMEVAGVTLCSAIERSSIPFIGNGEASRKRIAPWQAYPLLTVCLLMSSSLASWSLDYINFPTKVVFRSCKLLPTMILAYLMGNAKRFTVVEIGSAMAVCAGLITFAAGDWSLSQPQFHPFGLTLVTLSVFADSVLPNAQEKLFRTYDASKSEVMFFTNIYTLVVQTGSAFLSGDLMGMFHFVMGKSKVQEVNYFYLMGGTNSTSIQQSDLAADEEEIMETPASGEIRHTFILCMIAYILISWIAVSAHTAVVKKFGGVAAVFVGTARKGMTLILSFALFPKESNWKYAVGAILVLGGLTVASLEKQRKKSLPFASDPNQSEGHLNNGDGDCRKSERQALINLDVELGRSSSSTLSNG